MFDRDGGTHLRSDIHPLHAWHILSTTPQQLATLSDLSRCTHETCLDQRCGLAVGRNLGMQHVQVSNVKMHKQSHQQQRTATSRDRVLFPTRQNSAASPWGVSLVAEDQVKGGELVPLCTVAPKLISAIACMRMHQVN